MRRLEAADGNYLRAGPRLQGQKGGKKRGWRCGRAERGVCRTGSPRSWNRKREIDCGEGTAWPAHTSLAGLGTSNRSSAKR